METDVVKTLADTACNEKTVKNVDDSDDKEKEDSEKSSEDSPNDTSENSKQDITDNGAVTSSSKELDDDDALNLSSSSPPVLSEIGSAKSEDSKNSQSSENMEQEKSKESSSSDTHDDMDVDADSNKTISIKSNSKEKSSDNSSVVDITDAEKSSDKDSVEVMEIDAPILEKAVPDDVVNAKSRKFDSEGSAETSDTEERSKPELTSQNSKGEGEDVSVKQSEGDDKDGKDNVNDKDGSGDKSSGKEKNIDAIAKKLKLQMKSAENSEDANESKENEETENKIEETVKEKKEPEIKVSEKIETPKEKKKKKNRTCEECGATKGLKFQLLFQGKVRYMCSESCFKSFKAKQNASKPVAEVAPSPKIPEVKPEPVIEICGYCKKELKEGRGFYPSVGEVKPLCSEECLISYQESNIPQKKCSQCKKAIEDDISCLSWETMEFCNEDCLGKYQSFLGSHCTCCQAPVQQTSLGKYCVCFGADIRQFCSGSCLEDFKKGLKVCSFCQKDLSSGVEGFLAPVGDKGQFKDFCTQQCMERYETMNNNNSTPIQSQPCTFCGKQGVFKIKVKFGDNASTICSDNCVAGYRYKNKITLKMCDTCYKFFDPEASEKVFTIQFEGVNKYYCTKACMTLFVLSHRKIVPCTWCKVKKYNFDMIEKLDSSNQMQTYCSLNCISLYRVSVNATSAKSIRCDNCTKSLPAQYHLTMSDGSIRNFCNYQCVIQFQNQFTTVPTLTTTTPSNKQSSMLTTVSVAKTTTASNAPVISNVMSLASTPTPRAQVLSSVKLFPQRLVAATVARQSSPPVSVIATKAPVVQTTTVSASPATSLTVSPSTQVLREVIVKPPAPKSLKNKAILCKPIMQTKGISCKPHPCHKAVQTEEGSLPTIVPIPVPIYIPAPVHMFSRPVPCPVPFPIPIPVPIFIPSTKDSPSSVLKQLKEIQEKIPSNPFEAELLMMAEMVAENDDKSIKNTNGEEASSFQNSDDIINIPDSDQGTNEAPLDLEAALPPGLSPAVHRDDDDDEYCVKESRSSKRSAGRSKARSKRPKVEIMQASDNAYQILAEEQNSAHNPDPEAPARLKYAFGVNAWKHWVLQKNADLEKGAQSARKIKPFKTDLLQLAPDELNYSLCLFVKEVRKPSGEEYAPASIYYLCLGIQQYLFENGRIDNIFTDTYYEKFTECLNDVLLNQDEMMTSEGYFISRIDEEVLWESKQLGAHSPHVLLNTLMYYNTKHFNLKSADEHTHLSFSHITKHWRKAPVKAGPRGVVLRYYPPLTKEWQGRRRKDEPPVYEQVENLDIPLRCPVKLYEFYLSKCPESVKTRNDVFYLYPERSCVPDSPVWYSTQPLGRDMILKMLQRIKTVREIYET